MMDKEKFSRLLLDTQAQYLLNKGRLLTNINRPGQLVALYTVGKRFYEIVYRHPKKELVSVDEITAEKVMQTYLNQL